MAVAGAAGLGHGNALAAGEIVAGNAALGLADILYAACGYDLAAVHTGTGAYVHDIVRAAHGVLVVLDHNDRIAQIPQVFQGSDELIVVPLMQADGRLVQHIEHTGQSAADLGGQADALALAAGQRARRPGQREVIQTHALQKLQAVFDLLHDLAADLLLLFGEVRLVLPDKFQLVPDGHLAELADVLVPDGHGKHHRLQALSVAVRTLHAGHKAADFFLHPLAARLAEAALQIFHNALKGVVVHPAAELVGAVHLDLFAVGAVEQGVHRLGAHLLDGRIQRKAVFFTKAKIIHLAHRAFSVVPAAGLDGTLPDGKAAVGQDAILVHPHKGAKAGAFFAGAQRVIEGEQPGRQVTDGNAVLRAGKVLAEGHTLAADDIHLGHAPGERQRGLQRVRQTAADALAQGKTVHHDFHRMLDVLFQTDLLVQIIQVAIDFHAGITGAAGGVQFLLLGALALTHHRG